MDAQDIQRFRDSMFGKEGEQQEREESLWRLAENIADHMLTKGLSHHEAKAVMRLADALVSSAPIGGAPDRGRAMRVLANYL